jgi:hypothetical protein
VFPTVSNAVLPCAAAPASSPVAVCSDSGIEPARSALRALTPPRMYRFHLLMAERVPASRMPLVLSHARRVSI